MAAHTIRILGESKDSAFNIRDAATLQPPFYWRGNDVRLEVALSTNGAFLTAAQIGTITVVVKALDAGPDDSPVMLKTIAAAACDATFTASKWTDGTGQLFVAEWTRAEAAIAAGDYSLVISHDDPSGDRSTHLRTKLTVREDQHDSVSLSAPPTPPLDYYTTTESDGRFLSKVDDTELADPEKAAAAGQWPEAVLYPKYDKIVVDGDSRSAGAGVGDWPTRLAAIKPFDVATITSVAVSGAQAFERLAAFDTDVLPLAPTGSERGLYVLYIGVNDLFQVGGANYTVTRDIYDTIKELWAKARAAGFDVCAVTLQDADHTGTGVPFREERQELLNRMILAGSAHYDFVVPLHELCPDYTVFNTDALHFGADGNQFIAEQVAKILGASDRTANSARQGQGLAEMEFNAIPASINAGRFLWPHFNLAMATEDTSNSGTVTNLLGMKRLTAAASAGSVAAIWMRWLLVNSANRINWPTVSRYRGVVVSFARGTMSGDHVFRVSVGNNTEVFDVAGFGFELRNNGGAIEMRAIATDSSLVVNNSAWEVIGANPNLLVVAFAKGTDVTVLWSASNGSNPYEVWQTISTTGAPTGVGGGGNVCAALETTAASPSAQSVIDVRSIQAFESETLPLSATKFDYH